MKMKCPHCGVSGDAPQVPINRLVKCPRCTEIFLIPEVAERSEPLPSQEPFQSQESGSASSREEPIFDEQDMFGSFAEEFRTPESTIDKMVFPDDRPEDDEQIELDFPDEIPVEESPDLLGDELEEPPPVFATGEREPVGSVDAEQIKLDIAAEIDAEEATDELDIPIGEGDSTDLVEWTQQFDELTEPLATEGTESTGETERKEEVISEEFFNFDETSEADTLDIDTPGSDSSSDASVKDSPDYPDFSEGKITWTKEEGEETLESDNQPVVQPAEDEIQAELKELLTTTCAACDNTVEGDALYCQECIKKRGSDEEATASEDAPEEASAESQLDESPVPDAKKKIEIPSYSLGNEFAVGATLKEAFILTRGAKGAIWGGIVVMYLVIFVFAAGGFLLFEMFGATPDTQMIALGGNAALEMVNTIFSILFAAGLLNIGVRRVADKDFSWRTAFSGFAKFGKVIIAGLLITLMLGIGFLLLVLPGIYLMVGYSLALPLILDRDCGIWEAMEGSRKAIHKKWWKVFGLYLVMYLIFLVSLIPLGIGMIWTVPMFFMLAGILYRLLLPAIKTADS